MPTQGLQTALEFREKAHEVEIQKANEDQAKEEEQERKRLESENKKKEKEEKVLRKQENKAMREQAKAAKLNGEKGKGKKKKGTPPDEDGLHEGSQNNTTMTVCTSNVSIAHSLHIP